MITYTRQVPVLAEPDVLVCGAGCAGFDGLVDSRSGEVVVGGVALEMIVRMGLLPDLTSVDQVRRRL